MRVFRTGWAWVWWLVLSVLLQPVIWPCRKLAQRWARASASVASTPLSAYDIHMGVPLHRIVNSASQLQHLQHHTQTGTRSDMYLVHVVGASPALAAQVVLHPQATRRDECQAFFHAAVLVREAGPVNIDQTFAAFYASVVASGWDVSDVCITDGGWRSQWTDA
jgi:hypothetical protein